MLDTITTTIPSSIETKTGTHLIIPSNTTSRIQESHTLIIHIWCKLIDEAFTASDR